MLIKEIEPIRDATVNLLQENDEHNIDKIIELPLRRACKIFKQKGIETIMSSANKNNIVKSGEKVIEKEDVYGNALKIFENHTFFEAGKGYAWIMLNFDSLSDENKDLVFQLEDDLGPKAVWFAHPAEMDNNIEFCLKIGKYDYNFVRQLLDEESIPKNIQVDDKLVEFEKRHIVLLYPWTDSSTEAVFLRMPINEQTLVEEVEEYFADLAKCFSDQIVNMEIANKQKSCRK